MKPQRTIDEIFSDSTLMLNAIREAGRDALIMHKRLGHAIVDVRDGKCVWIQPEDIVIPPPIEEEKSESDAA